MCNTSKGYTGFDSLTFRHMVVEVLMDTCWIVNPELRARYPSITPWGLIPAAEEYDLKSFQGGFESHSPYQTILKITVAFFENMSYKDI